MGLLVKLLLAAPLLLGEEVQAIVADLGQADPRDGSATGGEGVAGLIALAGDTGLMLLDKRLVDGLPVFLGGVPQLFECGPAGCR